MTRRVVTVFAATCAAITIGALIGTIFALEYLWRHA